MLPELLKEALLSPGLLKEIYGDLAKPGVKQVGIAIEGVLGLGNTILYPLLLLNGRAGIAVNENLERYRKKMESVPEEDVVPVPPEVGVPILEQLAYVEDEKLREMYINLLARASDKKTNSGAHPSFSNIIKNMSPDEALMVNHIKDSLALIIHTAHIRIPTDDSKSTNEVYLMNLELMNSLIFQDKIEMYMKNLILLGLCELNFEIGGTKIIGESKIQTIQGYLKNLIGNDGLERSWGGGQNFPIVLSEMGKEFVGACL